MNALKCPICGQLVKPDAEESVMPFCSRRCQQIDLSRWLGEEYGLPVEGHEDLEYETETTDGEES